MRPLADALGRLRGHVLLTDEKPQSQVAFVGWRVEGEPGGIGAPVLTTVQHLHQGLADAQMGGVRLEHDAGDSAHVY